MSLSHSLKSLTQALPREPVDLVVGTPLCNNFNHVVVAEFGRRRLALLLQHESPLKRHVVVSDKNWRCRTVQALRNGDLVVACLATDCLGADAVCRVEKGVNESPSW